MTHPTIFPRNAWHARGWRKFDVQAEPRFAFVHHSDDPDGQRFNTLAKQAARVKGIQDFHMDDPDHRWNDIAYHFLIFQYVGVRDVRNEPRVFTGRLLAFEPAAQEDYNMGTLAICVVGNGDKETLTPQTQTIIRELIRKFPTVRDLRPHSANPKHPGGTECPGSRFRAHVADIARRAGVHTA